MCSRWGKLIGHVVGRNVRRPRKTRRCGDRKPTYRVEHNVHRFALEVPNFIAEHGRTLASGNDARKNPCKLSATSLPIGEYTSKKCCFGTTSVSKTPSEKLKAFLKYLVDSYQLTARFCVAILRFSCNEANELPLRFLDKQVCPRRSR